MSSTRRSIPNLEIGLWNAWIFMLYHQLLCIVLLGSKGLLIKSSATTPHKKIRRKVVTFLGLIYYLALIYSFFLPLKLGTTWFYIGLPIASEERFCLEKYGDAYREYMNRTPRYIGIPKSKEK